MIYYKWRLSSIEHGSQEVSQLMNVTWIFSLFIRAVWKWAIYSIKNVSDIRI